MTTADIELLRRILSDPFFDMSPWAKAVKPRLVEAVNELEELRRWKEEAISVLQDWDLVWEAMGKPGELGTTKSGACLEALQS